MFLLFITCRFVLLKEKPWRPNGLKGLVTRIIDGRTVELKDELFVHLLGEKGSEASKTFLESNVLGGLLLSLETVAQILRMRDMTKNRN